MVVTPLLFRKFEIQLRLLRTGKNRGVMKALFLSNLNATVACCSFPQIEM